MICGPARFRRLHALEAKLGKVQFFDKGIDNAYRVVFGNVIIQQLGQQRALSSIFTLNEALHVASVLMRYWINVYGSGSVYPRSAFLHSLGR